MIFNKKINQAVEKATRLHDGQKRRDGELAYIIHPLSVALIISEYTQDEDVIIAAIMHDTIEDTPYVFAELERDFGERVANIVHGVTEEHLHNGHQLSWKEKKEATHKVLETASEESMLVRAADSIHNLYSLLETYEVQGDELLKRFHASIEEKLEHERKKLEIITRRLQNPVVEAYKEIYENAVQTFNN